MQTEYLITMKSVLLVVMSLLLVEGLSHGKQTCIARSTMESEFIALELAGQEAEWLKGLLVDVPLWGKQATPISLHCDSQAAVGAAHNSVYNGKRRHIRIRHSVVKQLLKHGVISL